MSHAIVRTDNMSGTTDGARLKSGKYMVSTTETAIDNGCVVTIDGLISGETEIFKAVTPTASTALDALYLVASPEINYEKNYANLDTFVNKAGDTLRLYQLVAGNTYSVTAEALDGTPAVGKIVEAQAKVTPKVVSSLTSGSTQIGKIIAKETVGSKDYFVILVG